MAMCSPRRLADSVFLGLTQYTLPPRCSMACNFSIGWGIEIKLIFEMTGLLPMAINNWVCSISGNTWSLAEPNRRSPPANLLAQSWVPGVNSLLAPKAFRNRVMAVVGQKLKLMGLPIYAAIASPPCSPCTAFSLAPISLRACGQLIA